SGATFNHHVPQSLIVFIVITVLSHALIDNLQYFILFNEDPHKNNDIDEMIGEMEKNSQFHVLCGDEPSIRIGGYPSKFLDPYPIRVH
uniref:Uncharacterized protein n=1 Tax=Romanomermis culicivorax TaxID=13658 RepID=A0A915I7X4_ROMCU